MKLKSLVKIAGFGAVAAAVYGELRKDPQEREWHGRLGGVVPYEFRVPTLSRVRDAMWNPMDERVFTDTAFGVGWSVNLARVAEKVKGRLAA